jgi:hypothetical protein
MVHIVSAERNIGHHRCLQAGQGIQASEQLAAELRLFGDLAVPHRRQLEIHRHYVRGIEPGIHRAQPPKSLDQQTGPHQQHQSER